MKRSVVLIAIGSLVFISLASGKTKTPPSSWATLDQQANHEIAKGGIYSRGWGAASPKLKYIVTQMIYMKWGHGYVGRQAWCYAHRESGLNPLALSRTNDHHVFQLNYSAHHNSIDFSRLDKPEVGYGIIAAWRMSKAGRDFSAWSGGSHSCPQGNEP